MCSEVTNPASKLPPQGVRQARDVGFPLVAALAFTYAMLSSLDNPGNLWVITLKSLLAGVRSNTLSLYIDCQRRMGAVLQRLLGLPDWAGSEEPSFSEKEINCLLYTSWVLGAVFLLSSIGEFETLVFLWVENSWRKRDEFFPPLGDFFLFLSKKLEFEVAKPIDMNKSALNKMECL